MVCPGCGATGSIEAFETDANARSACAVAMQLPHQVKDMVFPYLGRFRTGTHGLAWNKVLRLLVELERLLTAPTVHWDGGEHRPCSPDLWARAMEAVLSRRPTGLTNHNYLRHTAWEMARGHAARAEGEREAERRKRSDGGEAPPFPLLDRGGNRGAKEGNGTLENRGGSGEAATDAEREDVLRMLKNFGGGSGRLHE